MSSDTIVSDELQPDDLEEGWQVELAWSPKGPVGAGNSADGEVTEIWRDDGNVRQFTVEADDEILNVYTEYRDPPVERVTGFDSAESGADDPTTETIGRLDQISRVGAT